MAGNSYPSALGSQNKRIMFKEATYPLVQGFPVTSGQTVHKHMLVRLINDGTVSPVTASTQKPLGRVASDYQGDDKGNVRVVTPYESIIYAEASGTLDEGNDLAYMGLNADNRPIFKVAASGDYIVATALQASTTGGIALIGLLPLYTLKP